MLSLSAKVKTMEVVAKILAPSFYKGQIAAQILLPTILHKEWNQMT